MVCHGPYNVYGVGPEPERSSLAGIALVLGSALLLRSTRQHMPEAEVSASPIWARFQNFLRRVDSPSVLFTQRPRRGVLGTSPVGIFSEVRRRRSPSVPCAQTIAPSTPKPRRARHSSGSL